MTYQILDFKLKEGQKRNEPALFIPIPIGQLYIDNEHIKLYRNDKIMTYPIEKFIPTENPKDDITGTYICILQEFIIHIKIEYLGSVSTLTFQDRNEKIMFKNNTNVSCMKNPYR